MHSIHLVVVCITLASYIRPYHARAPPHVYAGRTHHRVEVLPQGKLPSTDGNADTPRYREETVLKAEMQVHHLEVCKHILLHKRRYMHCRRLLMYTAYAPVATHPIAHHPIDSVPMYRS